MTATLSSKGQLVLPKAIRTSRRWTAGTVFAVEEASGGILLLPVQPATGSGAATLDDVIGCTGYHGTARTLAEMDAGIIREARRAWPKPRRRHRVEAEIV
jgi:AbrB family looped-hinge helix DNA binding protein